MNLKNWNSLIFGIYVLFNFNKTWTEAATILLSEENKAESTGSGYPVVSNGINSTHSSNSSNEDPAVTRFRDYLRIATVHPNPDDGYKVAIEWLRGQASDIGLDFTLVDLNGAAEFALWLTWHGSDPSLKAVFLTVTWMLWLSKNLQGGIANNIIPSEVVARFDMRIRDTTLWNFDNVTALLDKVVEAGRLGSNDVNIVTLEFVLKSMETEETVANDSNIWWTVVQKTCQELGLKCPATVICAYTDGRYIRALGIPVFGIKTFLNTPSTAHKDN